MQSIDCGEQFSVKAHKHVLFSDRMILSSRHHTQTHAGARRRQRHTPQTATYHQSLIQSRNDIALAKATYERGTKVKLITRCH
jgi:hypothetical protein